MAWDQKCSEDHSEKDRAFYSGLYDTLEIEKEARTEEFTILKQHGKTAWHQELIRS